MVNGTVAKLVSWELEGRCGGLQLTLWPPARLTPATHPAAPQPWPRVAPELLRENIRRSHTGGRGGQADVWLGSAWHGGSGGDGPVGQPYAIKVTIAHRGRRPLGADPFDEFVAARERGCWAGGRRQLGCE